MNLKISTTCILISIVLFFAGCNKDSEPEPGVSGRISFDGVAVDVKQGLFLMHPDEQKNQQIGLLLMDDQLKVIEKNGVISDIEGSGDGMIIVFYSHHKGELSQGEYTFNNGSGQGPGNCIYISPLVSEKDDEVYECIGGRVEVSRSGNQYEFDLAMTYQEFDAFGATSGRTAYLIGEISGNFTTYRSEISFDD